MYRFANSIYLIWSNLWLEKRRERPDYFDEVLFPVGDNCVMRGHSNSASLRKRGRVWTGRGEGSTKKVAKSYAGRGRKWIQKSDATSVKFFSTYFFWKSAFVCLTWRFYDISESNKEKNIQKAICAPGIAILPDAKHCNCTILLFLLSAWVVDTCVSMCESVCPHTGENCNFWSFLLLWSNVTWLTLSWRRPLTYRNRKSMDWFLYDNGLHHERVKQPCIEKNSFCFLQ